MNANDLVMPPPTESFTQKSHKTVNGYNSNNKNPNSKVSDCTILRESSDIDQPNINQIIKILQNETFEVKNLIINECDLIFECLKCKDLFRSITNYIEHKRIFCTKLTCNQPHFFEDDELYSEQNLQSISNKSPIPNGSLDSAIDSDLPSGFKTNSSNKRCNDDIIQTGDNLNKKTRVESIVQNLNEQAQTIIVDDVAEHNNTTEIASINDIQNEQELSNSTAQNRLRIVKVSHEGAEQYQVISLESNEEESINDETTQDNDSSLVFEPFKVDANWTEQQILKEKIIHMSKIPPKFSIIRQMVEQIIDDQRKKYPGVEDANLRLPNRVFSRLFKCRDLLFQCPYCQSAPMVFFNSATRHLINNHKLPSHKSRFIAFYNTYEKVENKAGNKGEVIEPLQSSESNASLVTNTNENGSQLNKELEETEIIILTDDDEEDTLNSIDEEPQTDEITGKIINENNSTESKTAKKSNYKNGKQNFATILSFDALQREIGSSILYSEEIQFENKGALLETMMQYADYENLHCIPCGDAQFINKTELMHHITVKHLKALLLACRICRRYTTSNVDFLQKHMSSLHGVSSEIKLNIPSTSKNLNSSSIKKTNQST